VRPKFTELQLRDQCTRGRCIKIVEQTLLEIEESTFTNLLRVHYSYLVKTFKQAEYDSLSPSPKKTEV